ncbi:MAG: ECF transporter S component [Acutalibacteraceae bacterium]|jgi:energy-coupling factor transport system substrate-specific component
MDKAIRSPQKMITACLLLIGVPLIVVGGAMLFQEKHYAWISLCVAILSCLPLFICFERKDSTAKELITLAVLVAVSAAGRFAFAWVPGFKPVTAITVIAAMYLGREAGFVVGALSAVVSNFYFGQGPWTPFQMFAWGFLGFLAGVLAQPLKRQKIWMCLYGVLAGVLFSLIMDVWSTLWADGGFNLSRYLAACISALPFTIEYAVSNVIFLLLLTKPIGEKLERIKRKYGLFD